MNDSLALWVAAGASITQCGAAEPPLPPGKAIGKVNVGVTGNCGGNIVTVLMRRILRYATFVLALLSCAAAAQTYRSVPEPANLKPPGTVQDNTFFPFSVWYSGGDARAPMVPSVAANEDVQSWVKDLKQIKALGFNTVRTWVSWADAEPTEGKYDFTHLRKLMELANQVGLKVIIQVYVDAAPDWVGQKFGPDALIEAQNGQKLIPQAAPGYSIDNSGVRLAIANFYSAAARVAIQYPNFYGWDIWSEPSLVNWIVRPWVAHAQYGFNPYTQDRFRQWLKLRYQTLDKLNSAWGRHFTSWSEVSAPRFSTILSYTDFIDWKLFLYDKAAEDMQLKYDAIRSVDSSHVITAHASPPSILSTPMSGIDTFEDFRQARVLDYYGLSMYPYHNNRIGNWTSWMLELQPDFSYAANRQHGGFYVGELQAGQGTVGLKIGDHIGPSDEREWIWTAIAEGAKAINVYAYYPMSTGYESGGYGLINLDGTLTRRAREAGLIASTVTKHAHLFADSVPVRAQVALLYNPLSQMIGGYNNVGTDVSMLPSKSLIGYYRYFIQQNIPVTFVDRAELTAKDLAAYKLVIVPDSLVLTQQAASELAAYVRAGGHLVGEARMAWNNQKGEASARIPGLGLSDVFGVEEAKVEKHEHVPFKITSGAGPIAHGIDGQTVQGAFFAESLQPLPTATGRVQVLAQFEDGTPAMTVATYGKGKALYIGSFLGLARQESEAASNADNALLQNVLDWADVQPPLSTPDVNGEQVEVRLKRVRDTDSYLLFAINHQKQPQDVSIDIDTRRLRLPAPNQVTIKQLFGNAQRGITDHNDTLGIPAKLGAQGVAVWYLSSSR